MKCNCKSLKPTGEFKTFKGKSPFVVVFPSGNFVEASSLLMAQAAACGIEGSEIKSVVSQ